MEGSKFKSALGYIVRCHSSLEMEDSFNLLWIADKVHAIKYGRTITKVKATSTLCSDYGLAYMLITSQLDKITKFGDEYLSMSDKEVLRAVLKQYASNIATTEIVDTYLFDPWVSDKENVLKLLSDVSEERRKMSLEYFEYMIKVDKLAIR